jgi:hypothetical protein
VDVKPLVFARSAGCAMCRRPILGERDTARSARDARVRRDAWLPKRVRICALLRGCQGERLVAAAVSSDPARVRNAGRGADRARVSAAYRLSDPARALHAHTRRLQNDPVALSTIYAGHLCALVCFRLGVVWCVLPAFTGFSRGPSPACVFKSCKTVRAERATRPVRAEPHLYRIITTRLTLQHPSGPPQTLSTPYRGGGVQTPP